MSTKLSLRVHRVKCVDETGGKFAERIGNDEIYLGGFAVNEKGETVNIAPVSIYPHFDDGDVKNFNPPKVFNTFHLPPAGQWQAGTPFGYAVGLVLVEKDAGDMVGAVEKITNKAEAIIKEKLAEVRTSRANAGTAVGISSRGGGGVGAILLEALKLAAPFLIDFFKRNIIAAFKDEIFTPQIAEVSIPSPNFTWSGSLDSAEKVVRFKDHSGIYELTYDWKLS